MKKIKLLVMSCILGTSLFFLNNIVSAKASAIVVNSSDGKIYEYSYNALKVSATAYALNGINDSGAKLYSDFLSRKSSIKAFYDDTKKSYIDFSTIANAAANSASTTTKFDFNSFLENSSTPSISLTTSKVIADSNGNLSIDVPLVTTGNIDLSSITTDTKVVPFSTLITFKTNISNPSDYDITLKGTKCVYGSTTNKWAVTLTGTYANTDFTQDDFVLTKKNINNTVWVDMDNIVTDSTTIPKSTIIIFKLNVSDPQDYYVKVKGTDALFNSVTGKFAVTIDGTFSKSDLLASDFIIVKKDSGNTGSDITISKIDNINASVTQGDSYSLPSTVKATMSDGNSKDVSVVWDKSVDTSTVGTYIFNGTVSGYSGTVVLTLSVKSTNTIITFKDRELEYCIRDIINKYEGDIYKNDVKNIIHLNLSNSMIKDISGIENLTNLQTLDLSWTQIGRIDALKGLTNLQSLNLDTNHIGDISALRGLTNLKKLDLYNNPISDISALSGLTNLEELELGYTYNDYLNDKKPFDISVLKGLNNLKKLGLSHDYINDISPLEGLTNLQELNLNFNDISDINPLIKLTNLKELDLYANKTTSADEKILKHYLPNCSITF